MRLYAATYFVVASLYCLMVFIPFTYLFVIINPPYWWITEFAKYNLLFL